MGNHYWILAVNRMWRMNMKKVICLFLFLFINVVHSNESGAYFYKSMCSSKRDLVSIEENYTLDNYKTVTMRVDSVIISCDSVYLSMVQLNILTYYPIKLLFAINLLDSSVVRMLSDSARWAKWPFLTEYHPINTITTSAENKLINFKGELVSVLLENSNREKVINDSIIVKPGIEYLMLKEILKQCNMIMNNDLQIVYPKEETGQKIEHYSLGERIIQFSFTFNDETKKWLLTQIHEVFWMNAQKSREKIFIKLDKLKLLNNYE